MRSRSYFQMEVLGKLPADPSLGEREVFDQYFQIDYYKINFSECIREARRGCFEYEGLAFQRLSSLGFRASLHQD